VLIIILSALLSLQTPVQQPGARNAMPPSTMAKPVYVEVPVTIEIVNMTPQVVSDLVASGKIAIDGANHLNIPQGPMMAKLGPDMLRPGSQAQQIPANSAERPLKLAANHPLLVAAPTKFALVSSKKVKLSVQGNRLILTELR
jgi:hypothetical protein